jgi:phosphorylcholine metabolism protein LicD
MKEFGLDLVKKVCTALNSKNIPYFIDFGTLLGIIRDHGLVPGDDDVDMGIYLEDEGLRPVIKSTMESIGFVQKSKFNFHGKIVEECFRYKDICVDFFYYDVDKWKTSATCHYFYLKPTDRDLTKWRAVRSDFAPIEDFVFLDFEGVQMRIPNPPEKALESRYGPNWRIPISKDEWDYWDHQGNVRLNEWGDYIIL